MSEATKQCTKCQQVLPADLVHFHKHGAGLRPDCKACRKAANHVKYVADRENSLARSRKWYQANRNKVAQRAKRWREVNPEKRAAIVARFHAKNPHKNTEYSRRWRERNREQYNEIDRAYRAKNRERIRANAAKLRASDRARYCAYQHNRKQLQRAGGCFTAKDIEAQYAKQHGCCFWCSCELSGLYHIDHVIPVSRGGSNTPDNLVVACPQCNHRKSSSLAYTEWTPPRPLRINT